MIDARSVTRVTAFAGSALNLKARPIFGNEVAVLSNTSSITWAAHVAGTSTSFASGTLTLADVMQAAETASGDGTTFDYTFLWNSPGTNWPTAGTTYHIIVTITPTSGNAQKHVWIVTAVSPYG